MGVSLPVLIVNAETDILDSYTDETRISSYDSGIYVNTTAGHVRLSGGTLETTNAIDFDGTGDYTQTDNNEAGYTDKSFMFWIRFREGVSTWDYEIVQLSGSFFFLRQGGNEWQVYVHNSTHYVRYRHYTVETTGSGNWQHYAFNIKYSGVNPCEVSFFRNGTLTDNRTVGYPDYAYVSAETFGNLTLASVPQQGGLLGNFTMDEFLLYNRTLTATEVLNNYNSGAGTETPDSTSDLMFWYHFNESSGVIASDSSGNNKDADLKGNPEWVTGHVQTGVPYATDGELFSVNLLKSLNVTEIISFTYDATINNTEKIYLSFSQDNITYYNSTGNIGVDNITDGVNEISLEWLGMKGKRFFYKLEMFRGDASTPYLNSMILTFLTSAFYEQQYDKGYIIVLGLVAMVLGFTGLSVPFFGIIGLMLSIWLFIPLPYQSPDYLLAFMIFTMLINAVCLLIGVGRRWKT